MYPANHCSRRTCDDKVHTVPLSTAVAISPKVSLHQGVICGRRRQTHENQIRIRAQKALLNNVSRETYFQPRFRAVMRGHSPLTSRQPTDDFCALEVAKRPAPIIQPRKRLVENSNPSLPFDLRGQTPEVRGRIPAHLLLAQFSAHHDHTRRVAKTSQAAYTAATIGDNG
jgi:hypothetical protein